MGSKQLPLSIEAQVTLLRSFHDRKTSIGPLIAMPILLCWFYASRAENPWPMYIWAASTLLQIVVQFEIRKRYLMEEKVNTPASMLAKWIPILCVVSSTFGLMRVVPIGINWQHADQEFSALIYLTLTTYTARAIVSLPAILPVFLSFMLSIWVVAIFSALRMFPTIGEFVLPCIAIFVYATIRQGMITNQSMREQVAREERSQRLANDFEQAKSTAEGALIEKNLFLTTASHDLRQPIHAMTMLVETIDRRNKDQDIQPVLKDLKSSMSSMNLMFNSLLDLSRLESGSIQTTTTLINLNAMLKEVLDLFKNSANSQGLTLRLYVPKRTAYTHADPILLRQSLINLVQNAFRYTRQGGVLLGIRRRPQRWQVEVWDTGIGIATEDKDQVFKPYFRSAHAWKIDSAGHGVGLAVVARSADLMRATYGYQSRINKGSCFWLSLKSSEQVLMPLNSISNLPTYPTPIQKRKLKGRCLVLDDDPTVLAAWEAMLFGWGIEGRFAADAEQAFSQINSGFIPAAIFCDQRLRSGEDGFEILKGLLIRCPQASGAMISGELNSPQLRTAEQAGYVVFSKPPDIALLYAVLETWLDPKAPNEKETKV
jgi:signal transduction histidine kinase/CheY-like chemotaxis protein